MSPTADDGDIGPAWSSPVLRPTVAPRRCPVVRVVDHATLKRPARAVRTQITRHHVARLVTRGVSLVEIARRVHLSYNRVCVIVVDAYARGEIVRGERER